MTVDAARGEFIDLDPRRLTVPLWPDAGRAVGAGRASTYQMAREGRFPVRVLRLGSRRRVSVSDLRRYLGIDPPQ